MGRLTLISLCLAIIGAAMAGGCGAYPVRTEVEEEALWEEEGYRRGGGYGYGGYGGGYGGYGGGAIGGVEIGEVEEEGEEPLPEAEAPQADPARAERLVTYDAVLNVVVDSVEESMQRLKATFEAMGAYMQEMTSNSITFRVPADRFRDALDEVERLGEVTWRDIKGTDVTEKMRDLGIRLENAERFRQRLLDLLEKSQKVEDTLKIEKELGRVTETIELLKGKLRYLEHNVAFSTVTVRLDSALPPGIEPGMPFEWVFYLGRDLLEGHAGEPYTGQLLWWKRVKFDMPPGFVKYYEFNYTTRAMSAEGMFLYVTRYENEKNAQGGFWATLIRRLLVEQRAFAVKEEATLKLRKGPDAHLLVCTKQIGRKNYGYLVAIVARKKHVYVFEAWGPSDEFDKDKPKIEDAVKSMK